jgi:peptidoglycan hydrolase-like protein with peptidoglycan-binding domain
VTGLSELLRGSGTGERGSSAVPDMGRSPARRMRRLAGFTLGAACLAIASGLVGASLVKSPAEVAARTAPPVPSVITAAVVDRVLRETIVLRGTFGIGKLESFGPSSVASTAVNAGGGRMVVTGMFVRPGDAVHSGEVVAEVSDRPVFVLEGDLPLWRDLVLGESGKDVAELQSALAYLGFSSGADLYGYFGAGTEAAVKAFYRVIGYPPATQPVAAKSNAQSVGAKSNTQPVAVNKKGAAAPPAKKKEVAAPPAAIVPMSEAWFVPSLPAEVITVAARVGDTASGPLMSIAREGSLRLTGQLDPSEKALVKAGMAVSVYSSVTGYTGSGAISSVGTSTAQAGGGGSPYVPVRVRPRTSWPASLNGQNVQVTITAVTSGRKVLAVPVAAVSYDPAGQAQVIVAGRGGAERRIGVRTGMSAGGYVEITGTVGGAVLAAGTRVVVGQ